MVNILQNGRVILDPQDEEDGSISLLGYVVAYSDEYDWLANVDSAKKRLRAIFEKEIVLKPTHCRCSRHSGQLIGSIVLSIGPNFIDA